MSNSFQLNIAGMNVSVCSENELTVDEGYQPFLTDASPSGKKINVACFSGLKNAPDFKSKTIYKANLDGNVLWEIFKLENGLGFRVYEPQLVKQLQQVCVVDEDLGNWQVWSEPLAKRAQLNPLAYPLGPLIMYHLTLLNNAIMIHSSGVTKQGKGRVFTGVSGKGKTTMARLWFEKGAQVLNDDRLMIVKSDTGYRIHNTPMFYADKPRSATLTAIYIIYHNPENKIERLQGAEAASAVMANLIQHGYAANVVQKHLRFVGEMIAKIPIYRLGVLPTTDVVSFIENHDG